MSSLTRSLAAAAAAAVLFVPASAFAQPPPPSVPHPHAYGILVGTNAGGAGQTELRYAEDDAKRMAQVLKELGRYGTADMRVLVRPTSASVLQAVDEVAAKIKADRDKGEEAVLVFYYSGHAKANAFNLGSEELPIATLREKLRQAPSTLTFVVLDACQSGQFARVKGVEPAAEFSFNSVSRLTTKGIAVMASSSAQELSQESDALRSSYFTHHLIVGLRGAADQDGDGRVSLDEAYRYAYRRTLAATSKTKVGGQHVTLETDLSGQGDVPVTYPASGNARLELPASLDARVLVQQKPSDSVVAEVQKAPGSSVKLAFPAGSYSAIVRTGTAANRSIVECPLTLTDNTVTALTLTSCQSVQLTGIAKGFDDDDFGAPPSEPEDKPTSAPTTTMPEVARAAPWQLEAGIGMMIRQEDAFTERLNEFGYAYDEGFWKIKSPRWRLHLGASKGVVPHVSVGAYVHTLAGDKYERKLADTNDSFSWDAYGLSAFVRASTLEGGEIRPKKAQFEAFAQGALGVSLGVTTLTTGSRIDPSRSETSSETYWGYVLGGHGGVAITRDRLVFFAQVGYEYAPAIVNELGDTHNSGGPSGQLGMRLRFQ